MWKFRQDDLDTIFTVINQGLMKKPYWVEFHDTYEDGTPVWNGEKSVLWNLMEQAYPEEPCANDAKNACEDGGAGRATKGFAPAKTLCILREVLFFSD